jgi:hypothetical protein
MKSLLVYYDLLTIKIQLIPTEHPGGEKCTQGQHRDQNQYRHPEINPGVTEPLSLDQAHHVTHRQEIAHLL